MRLLVILLSVLVFAACNFKSSADYYAEAARFEQEGKYAEAIPLLDKAIESDPQNIYALINRGVDKSILQDFEGAIADYTRVIEIDPDNSLAFLNRGKGKNELQDFNGAIEDFDRAVKTKGSEMLHIDIVENSLVDTGFEFDVAMEEILYERGIARYYLDSLMLAFEDFSFCLEVDYDKPASLYWRGMIYLSSGMKTEGCNDLNEAQVLGDPEAREMFEAYCMGE